MGMTYAGIRKTARMKHSEKRNGFKNGGSVAKKSSTTINIVMPPARGQGAPEAPAIAPAGMTPPPSRMSAPPAPVPPPAVNAALGAMGSPPMMAKGGRVGKHSDAAADRAMVKKMVKPSAMKKSIGGKVPMTAGAGGGNGRLQKIKDYGKGK
jgi:hypothetical protein